MRCGVLYFDGFCGFEVVVALQLLAPSTEIVGVGIERRPYVSEEKQTYLPALGIAEAAAADFDVFLLPGGDLSSLLGHTQLRAFLSALDRRGSVIGAICGGVLALGAFGILEGKRFTGEAREFEYKPETLAAHFVGARYTGEDVVVEGNIVTAMGQAYVEFGLAVAEKAGVYPDAAAREHDRRWYKNL